MFALLLYCLRCTLVVVCLCCFGDACCDVVFGFIVFMLCWVFACCGLFVFVLLCCDWLVDAALIALFLWCYLS